MREILFRGKRIDNGDWAEGTPFQEYNNFWGEWLWFIQTKHPLTNVPYLHLEIDRKTISQFTGLTDKNGKKVFEGDIIKAIAGNPVGEPIVAKVIPNLNDYELMWDIEHSYELEIIGNIHDNPELLENP